MTQLSPVISNTSSAYAGPWRDVHSVERAQTRETVGFFEYGARNPCLDCAASGCCWYVHLVNLSTSKWFDFDYMRFALNFDDLEIVVERTGRWALFLRRPCNHLDRNTMLCNIRGTPVHPFVCRKYNPYHCWYRRTLVRQDPVDPIRLDRRRLGAVLRHAAFDEFGSVTRLPNHGEIRSILARSDGEEKADAARPERAHVPTPAPPELQPITRDRSPCLDCSAACCTNLLVSRQPPTSYGDVDFLRYMVGFPGVAILVTKNGWKTVVRTTCIHFDPGSRRCRVFGQPERPRRCDVFPAWDCEIRRETLVRAQESVWIPDTETFARIEQEMTYAEDGSIARPLGLDTLRRCVGAGVASTPASSRMTAASQAVGSDSDRKHRQNGD